MQILVVSSDLTLCQAIRDRMKDDFVEVCHMTSAVTALSNYMKQEYCLVVLDTQLSDADSIELIHAMRQGKPTPILAFTESLNAKKKIELFHAGANAYIDKPIDLEICAAQANALIQLYLDADNVHKGHNTITFGTRLIINPGYRQVIVDSEPLTLTRKEFDLLYCLASYPRQVFSREQLYNHVWGDNFAEVGEETVRVHIGKLRKKMMVLEQDFIHTVRGVGYRFMPPTQTKI